MANASSEERFKCVDDVINTTYDGDKNPMTGTAKETPAATGKGQYGMVQKTLEICEAMEEKFDTVDYIAGNQDAMVDLSRS